MVVMTLQLLRLVTVVTIAGAVVSALLLAAGGSDMTAAPAPSPSATGVRPAPIWLPDEPTAAGPAPPASAPAVDAHLWPGGARL